MVSYKFPDLQNIVEMRTRKNSYIHRSGVKNKKIKIIIFIFVNKLFYGCGCKLTNISDVDSFHPKPIQCIRNTKGGYINNSQNKNMGSKKIVLKPDGKIYIKIRTKY